MQALHKRRLTTFGFHAGAGTLAVLWLLPIALVLVTSVRSFDDIAANGLDWTIGFDPKGAAAIEFGTTGQPETYVFSPDGVAVCGSLGVSTAAMLSTWVEAARSGQECVT